VPGPGRHAGRPVAGSASPGRVSVAPRPHLGWWRHHLDLAHERWLLAQRFDDPAFRRPTPLPGDPIGPRRRPGGHRGRPGPWYDRHRSKMRWPAWPPTGASPAWVRSRWPARSVTAPVRHRRPVHGRLRSGPKRVLQWLQHHRGRITKCGNSHLRARLVESAWADHYRAAATGELRRRQAGLPPESSPGRGPRSCGCVAGSVAWPPATTPGRWRSSRSLGRWLGSCGLR
jgi:hypothetical protein